MAPNISVSMCTCKGHFWPARTLLNTRRVIHQHPILQDANVKLLQQISKQAVKQGLFHANFVLPMLYAISSHRVPGPRHHPQVSTLVSESCSSFHPDTHRESGQCFVFCIGPKPEQYLTLCASVLSLVPRAISISS